MKIRKFNEAKEAVDLEYVRNCFADLIDSGKAKVRVLTSVLAQDFNRVSMSIDLKDIKSGMVNSSPEFISRNTSLGRHIDAYESNNNVYQEVKLALERLADEYPNYKIKVDIFSSIFINIFP